MRSVSSSESDHQVPLVMNSTQDHLVVLVVPTSAGLDASTPTVVVVLAALEAAAHSSTLYLAVRATRSRGVTASASHARRFARQAPS